MKEEKINAYYLRLSLEDGDVAEGSAAESLSIASQRMCITQYIAENSLPGDNFIEFADDGYSGTNMERPAVQRLLELVREGRVKTIIVRDLSRFARNYLQAGHYLEFIFPMYEVRFISINDHYDSEIYGENPVGLDLAIKNLLNEMYSRDISRKIKSTIDLKKRKGEYVYGTAPYGYKKGSERNTIVPDEEAAVTVRRIFRLASEQVSVSEIARILNKEKIPTPSAHLVRYRSSKYKVYPYWSWDSVKNILVNRIYTGDTEIFKSHVVKVGSSHTKQIPPPEREIAESTHEALISHELYENAQKTIKSHKKKAHTAEINPLTSKLICGCCDSKLSKGKPQNKTWACTKARYTDETDCRFVKINEEEITGIILRAIQKECALADLSWSEQRQIYTQSKQEKQRLSEKLKIGEKALAKLEKEKEELLIMAVERKIAQDSYQKQKEEMRQKTASLNAEIAELQRQINELQKQDQEFEAKNKSAEKLGALQNIDKLTPEIMQKLVKKVTVYPDKRIEIAWNFADNIVPFLK